MGISLMCQSYGRAKKYEQTGNLDSLYPTDPNPFIFKVLDREIINNNLILLVKYPNCTTFSGKKLLLLKGTKYNQKKLDPHLLGKSHPVIARFEPNEQGWNLARICAKNI
jgi:hypothetical protein